MSISAEIRECKLCLLSSKLDVGFKPQPGIGKPSSKILVVYDSLSLDDYLTQNYLSGKEGLLFDKMLAKASLSREAMYITPLLKCYTGEAKIRKCYSTCNVWLKKQFEALKPKAMILFGIESVRIYCPKQPLKELCAQSLIKDNCKIFPMPSLINLLNMGQHMFNYHIDRLKEINKWVSCTATPTENQEKS